MMQVLRADIVEIVLQASRSAMADLPADQRKSFTPGSTLIGSDSPLDSLALVGLVIDVQETVRARFGVEVTLADERALSEPVNPFSTVEALAGYVHRLLEAER